MQAQWEMTSEQSQHYSQLFKEVTDDESGESMVDGGTAAQHLMKFGVERQLLSHIWCGHRSSAFCHWYTERPRY